MAVSTIRVAISSVIVRFLRIRTAQELAAQHRHATRSLDPQSHPIGPDLQHANRHSIGGQYDGFSAAT
jgi:hypothetical protein